MEKMNVLDFQQLDHTPASVAALLSGFKNDLF